MKNKYLRFLTSFILCGVILVNCNSFRRDTYAFGAVAIPVIVEGGEFVIYVTAAAASAIAGIIAGAGINAASREDEEDLIVNYSQWYIETYGYEAYLDMLGETGFKVEPATEPTADSFALPDVEIDVPGNKAGSFVVNPDGTYTNLDWYKNDELAGGSEPPPQNQKLGTRVVASFLATAKGLTLIGDSLYKYLHNSDSVVYSSGGMVQFIGNWNDVANSIFDSVNELSIANLSLDTNPYTQSKIDSFINNLGGVLNYNYIDMYFVRTIHPYGEDRPACVFALIGFNDYSSSCTLVTSRIELHISNNNNLTAYSFNVEAYPNSYDDALNTAYPFKLNSGYSKSINDYGMEQIAHYALSSVDSGEEVQTKENANIKVDDNVYTLDEDNIYNNANRLTEQAQAQANSAGNVLVAAPAYTDTGNVVIEDVTEPTAIDSQILNPNIELNPELSDATLESGNIFQLLRDFFLNFFAKLAQTIKNVAIELFVPSEGFFEDRINEIREKHCSSAGTIHFDELEIPDIIWNPSGSRWGEDLEPIVIVDNSNLRNNINSYREFLAGVIYITWLFHEMYRLLGVLNVVKVDKQ